MGRDVQYLSEYKTIIWNLMRFDGSYQILSATKYFQIDIAAYEYLQQLPPYVLLYHTYLNTVLHTNLLILNSTISPMIDMRMTGDEIVALCGVPSSQSETAECFLETKRISGVVWCGVVWCCFVFCSVVLCCVSYSFFLHSFNPPFLQFLYFLLLSFILLHHTILYFTCNLSFQFLEF